MLARVLSRALRFFLYGSKLRVPIFTRRHRASMITRATAPKGVPNVGVLEQMDIQAYFEDWSVKPGETARMAISTAHPSVRATLVRLVSGPGAAPAI
jgi:hypothetical protein